MTLTFYKTGFDVTKNGVYENIRDYLDDGWFGDYVLKMEYKHLDPALNQQIKLPISSHQFTKKNIGDYCMAEDEDGTLYYYYVMNCQWKGKETLLVTLGLDTLTTFWDEIRSSLTDETHITRRYKDRFYLGKSTDEVAYPQIDRKDEDFGTVPMVYSSRKAVNPSTSTRRWTLVYRTDYEQTSENLAQNPVSCFAIPSASVPITATSGSVDWAAGLFTTHKVFFLGANLLDEGDSFKCSFYASGTKYTISFDRSSMEYTTEDRDVAVAIVWSEEYGKWYVKRIHHSGDSDGMVQIYEDTSTITFEQCKRLYEQDPDTDTLIETYKLGQFYQKADWTNPYTLNASGSVTALTSFTEWYQTNKTDARLIKIRELPYAPFEERYKANGTLVMPSGWTLSGNLLKFTGTTFGNNFLANTDGHSVTTLKQGDIIDQDHSVANETKLYNSAYYGDKLVYDTYSWVAKWENFNDGKLTRDSLQFSINYAVSDGMDNGQMWSIYGIGSGGATFAYDTDYGWALIAEKNTDIPYYNNEYLNYLRYGKNVDEKAANLNIASSVISGVGSAASTVASFAFSGATVGSAGGPFGAGTGALIGAIVGVVTTAMSVAKTCATAYDTINSKIDAYTHQASSVSGTSDLSLFKQYAGNKLVNIVYEPYPEIKQMLYDYFRLYGYAADEYAIPTSTRRWVDYFKCEPVFSGDLLWNDFLDDIKQRMNLGFRVFHYVGHGQEQKYRMAYDLKQTKENWETTLWSWAGND
jgi:hypothetical protein